MGNYQARSESDRRNGSSRPLQCRLAPRRNGLRRYWLCGVALVALSAPASAQTIDTLPQWNGSSHFDSWGYGATATYGQTITAPTQSRLSGFTFELVNNAATPQSQFTASVYQWDSVNAHVTGPALFTSGVMTSPGASTFRPVTVNTGGVVLTPGQQYVLFLTTINVPQSGGSSYNGFGNVAGSSYAGGALVFQNSTSAADLSTHGWAVTSMDLAFLAQFGPTSLSPQLPTGSPRNPVNVAGGIDKVLDGGGNLSGGFQVLTGLAPAQLPGALTQLSGENGTATQQGGVQLMNLYLLLLTDPFAADRNGTSAGAMGFAPERRSTDLPPAIASAYAAVGKAPPLAQAAAQHWNVWGTAFGGSNKTNGDAAVVGSHDVRSTAGGFAAGADYRFSPDTRVGFSLAGGATSWSLAGDLGNGRSAALLAGVYGSHKFGAAYVSGALSYGNYWTSQFRTVRVAGVDTLRADFNAQDLGARIEGGYRIPLWAEFDMTPYAAVQVQGFRTPSYGEAAAAGSAQFALNYDARTATAVRTELGSRIGKSWLVPDGSVFNLFGKAAWAHDEVSDPRLNVSFVGLPVANFAVTGATPARDLALVSAGAEWQFRSGISVMAKFDGEFADRSLTYAGTARLRYAW